MNILVIGSGGREHALAWAIAGSPLADRGLLRAGQCRHRRGRRMRADRRDRHRRHRRFLPPQPDRFRRRRAGGAARRRTVDALEAEGIAAFGPTAAAAALEGSKAFMKDFCAREGIPTAAYRRFRDAEAAKAHIAAHGAPVVVKADGLAAGKGVVVAATLAEANAAVDAALGQGRFGAAGAEIVVEDFLAGEEASFFALVDGATALPLAAAQDHKRAFDGDTGPNTGGMGAYSPAPCVTPAIEGAVMERIVLPTVRAMARDGRPFKGLLYAGLMLTESGPKLLEYNVRFGDPECQALLMRLSSDLLPALLAARDGVLKDVDLRWYDETALCVVMAARGYPDDPLRGTEIRGLAAAASDPDVKIFHAGTRRDGDRLIADGGRVLGVTALGTDIAAARARAYAAIDRIDWPEGFCRRDIGLREVGE